MRRVKDIKKGEYEYELSTMTCMYEKIIKNYFVHQLKTNDKKNHRIEQCSLKTDQSPGNKNSFKKKKKDSMYRVY